MMDEFVRSATRITAMTCGGLGIFFVWTSFYEPSSAIAAIVLLLSATGLSLAVPQAR
jgi:hypothetical protein